MVLDLLAFLEFMVHGRRASAVVSISSCGSEGLDSSDEWSLQLERTHLVGIHGEGVGFIPWGFC